MRECKLQLLAGAIMLACSAPTLAGSYPNAYFFGDSLSDAGAFTNLVGADANKFTNNPGTIWAQNVGARYGIQVTAGYALDATMRFVATGGNDYAIGGARVTSTPGVFPASDAIAANITPATSQISTHLGQNGGAANSGALYGIWIGANDVFYQAGVVAAIGAGAIPQAGAAVVAAAGDEVAQIARLRAAGARNLVVLALPDMGATPYGAQNPATTGALLTQLSGAYNSALAQGLATAGITQLAFLDPRPLMADILARPAAWGITNTAIPACGAASSLGCGPAQQIPGSSNFLFADGVHPSAYTHRIIGDWVYGTLEAPGRMTALGELAIGGLDAQWRAVDGRTRMPTAPGLFIAVDHAPLDIDAVAGRPGLSGTGRGFTLGFDTRLAGGVAGVAVGLSEGSFDLRQGAGNIDSRQTSLSAFGNLPLGNAYLDGTVSYASLDFDTRRTLGPLINAGNAGGRQWGARIGGGYHLKLGDFQHGPVAALTWQKIDIDGFSENGITALSYAAQTRNSLRHRLGWQATGKLAMGWGQLLPYARLTHEKEYKDNQGTMTAGIVGTPFSFSTPTRNSTSGYGLLAVGTGMQFDKLRIDLGLTTTLNRASGREQSVSAIVSMPF